MSIYKKKNYINMSRCVYLLSASILTFIVYLCIMVHLKSLNSTDWQWRINSLEGDLKMLMENFNSCGDKNKPDSRTHSKLDSDVGQIADENAIEDIVKKHTSNIKSDIQEIRRLVDTLLCKNKETSLDANCKAEPINLATDSLGSKIVFIDDKPVCAIYNILYYFGIESLKNAPREILSDQMHPGRCYAFKGSTSTIVIRLQRPVIVSSISIEHVVENMLPYGNNSNAPKNFAVYGLPDLLDDSCEENCEHCFGDFQYKIELKQPLQMFQIFNKDPPCPYRFIKFSFLSNHGHPNHTCVYRIGVYGKVLY